MIGSVAILCKLRIGSQERREMRISLGRLVTEDHARGPKGCAGVAAAAAMNIRRQTLVVMMNNCTATVLQQGLHFPGSSSSERSEKSEERRDHKKGSQRSPN